VENLIPHNPEGVGSRAKPRPARGGGRVVSGGGPPRIVHMRWHLLKVKIAPKQKNPKNKKKKKKKKKKKNRNVSLVAGSIFVGKPEIPEGPLIISKTAKKR